VRWLLRRIGLYGAALWAALTLNFVLPRAMPGDPATLLFSRFRGRMRPEALEAQKEAFGLTDAPLLQQYIAYLSSTLEGNLGTSLAYFPTPVTEILGTGMMWTLFLAGGSLIVSFAVGTTLGAVAAWRRGGLLDSVLPPALSFLGAFPYFWLAMVALFGFGFTLDWLPVRHAYGPNVTPGWSWAFCSSVIRHAFLPSATLVLAGLAGWLLGMRNTMLTVLGDEFVTHAHARGLGTRRILTHYAVRNAILPNLAGFGMALGFVVSGALLTEVVFSYPGQGFLLLQAVQTQDYFLLQGIFLTLTLAVLTANVLVDAATWLLDPRTRR
jgi:peptide/nickel transport system permease protein